MPTKRISEMRIMNRSKMISLVMMIISSLRILASQALTLLIPRRSHLVQRSHTIHSQQRIFILERNDDICWVIAAIDCVCINLIKKGADYELIKLNCDKLLKCYEEENNNFPYIIKKAFKYVNDHNVSKDAFYPLESDCDVIEHDIPEEVKALHLTGFQMIDHKDEFAIMRAMSAIVNGPIIGGVRQSPEFIMLGNKIYWGSDNEIKIQGKYCNHGLVVCGYDGDIEKGTTYWRVKNSDGVRWGEEGYGKIARNSSLPNNRQNLLTTTMYPIFE